MGFTNISLHTLRRAFFHIAFDELIRQIHQDSAFLTTCSQCVTGLPFPNHRYLERRPFARAQSSKRQVGGSEGSALLAGTFFPFP